MKILKLNKRANFDYEILETFIAGISLLGKEVKSIKAGNLSLKEGFIRARKGEVFLINVYVAPYQKSSEAEDQTRRTRKLLLQKREIEYLEKKQQSGLTIIPMKVFLNRGIIKLEIAIARGRKRYDKREVLKKKATKRDIEIALKERKKS